MKILAIDPGYDRCGCAILTSDGAVLSSKCITTDKKDPLERRFAHVYRELQKLIETEQPDHIALETLFFSVNKKTVINVAQARGIVVLLAGIYSIPLVELSPQEVKIALTGMGNATKDQVTRMVSMTLKVDTSKKLDDEIDAIALGIASLGAIKQKSW
jgi:crossover junction endodeoxyribonuclease RuvC